MYSLVSYSWTTLEIRCPMHKLQAKIVGPHKWHAFMQLSNKLHLNYFPTIFCTLSYLWALHQAYRNTHKLRVAISIPNQQFISWIYVTYYLRLIEIYNTGFA